MDELEKDNKILRIAMLKKQYAGVIMKSQQQILGKEFDGKEMKKKVELQEKELREEKAKSLERDREAARIAMASIKRTVNFGDTLEAERDFLDIIGAPQRIVDETLFDKKEMKKNVESWEKHLELQEEEAKSQREKDREAAQIAIANIKRTINFGDGLQAEGDLLAILHAPSLW